MKDTEILKLLKITFNELQKEIETKLKTYESKDFNKKPKWEQELISAELSALLIKKETILKLKTAIKRIKRKDKTIQDYENIGFINYEYEKPKSANK